MCQAWNIQWFKNQRGKCKLSAKLTESMLVYRWVLMLQNKKSPTKEPFGISSKYQLLTCWKTSNSLNRCSREGWEQCCSRITEQVVDQPLTYPQFWELLEDVYTNWNTWYLCYIDLSKDLWITFPGFLWSWSFKVDTNPWALASRLRRETLTGITKEDCANMEVLKFSLGATSNGTNTFKSS